MGKRHKRLARRYQYHAIASINAAHNNRTRASRIGDDWRDGGWLDAAVAARLLVGTGWLVWAGLGRWLPDKRA